MILKENNGTYTIYAIGSINSYLEQVSYEELTKLYMDLQDIFEADYRDAAFKQHQQEEKK